MLMFTRGESGAAVYVYESRRIVYSATRVTPRASGARLRPPSLVRLVSNMQLAAETRVVMIAPPPSKVSDSTAAAQVSVQHCMLATIVAVTCLCSRLTSTPVKSIY